MVVGNALAGVLEVRRALKRPRTDQEDNINTDLREKVFGRCGVDWSATGWGQTSGSCVNKVMNTPVPRN